MKYLNSKILLALRMGNLKQYAAIWIYLIKNNLAQVPGLDTEKHIPCDAFI